jgi:hypothetical protein
MKASGRTDKGKPGTGTKFRKSGEIRASPRFADSENIRAQHPRYKEEGDGGDDQVSNPLAHGLRFSTVGCLAAAE